MNRQHTIDDVLPSPGGAKAKSVHGEQPVRVTQLPGWEISPAVWALLALGIVLELFDQLGITRGLYVGRVAVSPAVLPALGLLFALASGHLGSDRPWRVSTALATMALVSASAVGGVVYTRATGSGFVDAFGLLVSALGEEFVYRFAIPAGLAGLLMRVQVSKGYALMFSLAVSSLLFAALPGHVNQMDSLFDASFFVGFAVLMSHAVWRGGAFVPAVLAHTTSNLFTLSMAGGFNPITRYVVVSAALATLLIYTPPTAAARATLRQVRRRAIVPATLPHRSPGS